MSDGAHQHDIIIIGAGPAGLSFARTLSDTGLRMVLVERQPLKVLKNPPEDGRDIALTHTSETLMKNLGIWAHIPQDKIGTIRDAKVVDGTDPYALHFAAGESGADYLGRIVPNHLIRKAAYDAVKSSDTITILTEKSVTGVETDAKEGRVSLSDGTVLTAPLVVAADSRMSENRRRMGISAQMTDFGRVVIVCELTHELPHDNIATECFHYDRTLAILPMAGNKSSAVVTLPADQAEAVLAMSPEEFADDIAARFDHRLGRMELATALHPYPLMGVIANRFVANRFALVGDAAVGMHPVTAHGYNLGLSGAAILAGEIRGAKMRGEDIGSMAGLLAYERQHRRKVLPLYHGTNAIVRLFTDTSAPAKFLRSAALRLGNVLTPAKKLIEKQLTEIEA
ncbi:5-demethoxyubiquinol-8 5-hydroxylase UbiM [Sinisalibacter aestuarii]|uniref:Ubiquinone biosynthesis hydroxylase n=1 Tax=Sinisalibacter aestuarii TaxID=2949426 RepID=A0ABQ5LTW5_9RHOB|nr:5-demethoxyubiquinol-8 5-hydroxylase UbiM [Sinisalibacter aestuarii]GKY87562.1 ubiquinone biosynthesis hydroxylase [Sinisalibacter aestuarii]